MYFRADSSRSRKSLKWRGRGEGDQEEGAREGGRGGKVGVREERREAEDKLYMLV